MLHQLTLLDVRSVFLKMSGKTFKKISKLENNELIVHCMCEGFKYLKMCVGGGEAS